MTQVKINTALGGHAAGATIEVTPKSAAHLIENGHAEPVEAKVKPPRAQAKKPAEKAGEKPVDNEVGGTSPTPSSPTAG